MNIRDAAESLRKHLEVSTHPRSFTIGIAQPDELHVYLHKRLYKRITPDEWEGFTVKTMYVGKVKPAEERGTP